MSGNFDTHFVKKYFTPEVLVHSNDDEMVVAAIIAAKLHHQQTSKNTVDSSKEVEVVSKWKTSRLA